MKVVVLNGSPKGALGVSLHYALYMIKQHPRHDYEVVHVAERIDELAAQLLRDALGQDPAMRWFILRLLRALWSRRDAKVNALLMFLDRFDFARRLAPPGPGVRA